MRTYLAALIVVLSLSSSALSHGNLGSGPKAQEGQTKKTHKSDSTNPTILVQCGSQCRPSESSSQPKINDTQLRTHDWIDKLNAGATAVIAVFTMVLSGVTFYQVKNLRNVERAWFVIDTWTTPKELEYFNYISTMTKPLP